MGGMGYSTWTGFLHSEQYGVPQTRKRAYLIARRDGGVAEPPTPTHSKYYSRTPQKLDVGVDKWVSMAQALGWGIADRPYPVMTGHGTITRAPSGQQKIFLDAIADGRFEFKWPWNRPATTVVGSFYPNIISAPGYRTKGGLSRQHAPASVNVSLNEAAIIQSYPDGFTFAGSKSKQFLQVGNAVPPLVARAVLSSFAE